MKKRSSKLGRSSKPDNPPPLYSSKFERALDEALNTLGADSGTIHVKDPAHSSLHLAASRNVPDSILAVVKEVPWGKGMAGVAAERAAPVTFCNIQTSPSSDIHPKAKAAGVLGAIVVPMLLGHEVVGTIGV